MDKYLVLGNPIIQSRSPFIHQKFACQTNQQLSYDKRLVELDEFADVIDELVQNDFKGANVTAPFKEQALQLCDQLSPEAKFAGAVNTLSFINGKVIGNNTDGLGLVLDLKNQQVKLTGKRVLLLGAGGAARGVILPLLNEKPKQLVIANRTLTKAERLVKQFNKPELSAIGFTETCNNTFDVIINATSASLTAELPAISSSCITEATICYDMVYGKQQTKFLQWAQTQGAKQCIDGLGMLVNQAAVSFNIWRNVQPYTGEVLTELRSEL